MTTATAVPVEATPLDFGDSQSRLTSKIDLNRDKIRYVACLGNHLEPTDARQMRDIGGWAGGIWIGASEVEGCPTLHRTHHMILRGLFTPLETRPVMKKADHREIDGYRETYIDGPGIPPFTRGYTVYAGDDLNYLQGDRYRPMGVVEITSLMGVEWNTELRRSLQHFFFPEWSIWQRGEGEIPQLLSDWVDLVRAAQKRAQYVNHEQIAEELLESARLFRIYANNQIEKNRQAIQSMRAADHGGQTVGWHNKTRMYADQLGMVLEDERSIAPSAGNTDGLIAELREDRKLRAQELEMQKAVNAALIKKLTGDEVAITEETPVVTQEVLVAESVSFGVTNTPDNEELDLSPIVEEKDLTPGCSEFNGKGEPCRAKVKPGETKCTFHLKGE